ncbi:MAG TPA: histidine kinase [Chitinophagaceae bacterium]|nr:histidine kinase [Chitinophagaceae bacterium]
MPGKFSRKKIFVILIHVICWVLLFTLPWVLRPDRSMQETKIPEKEFWDRNMQAVIILGIILRALWIAIFYANANILVPRLVYKGRYRDYLLSLIGILVSFFAMDALFFGYIIKGAHFTFIKSLSFNLFPLIFILVASYTYRITVDQLKRERREKDTINENLKTELALLRSQVSPHFMFNVLNNMVALARKKSDLLEPSLIKLSQLLRYMLYETHERVSLKKEVEYLESYIDLQKQRFGNTVKITTSFEAVSDHHEIEPMLLIPFVENAFKHGVVMFDHPQIDINMHMENNTLDFHVRNTCVEESLEEKDKTSGIGLGNVKRRLELLYPDKHKLLINRGSQWFDVTLQIELT